MGASHKKVTQEHRIVKKLSGQKKTLPLGKQKNDEVVEGRKSDTCLRDRAVGFV